MFRNLLATAALLAGFNACAVIEVTPKMIEVGQGTTQVIIENKGDHVEYVTVTLSKLLNPGVPYEDEKLESIGLARHPQLYAYPFKISLARGQSKKINIKPLEPVTTETVYRLLIKPVSELTAEARENTAGGVTINVGYSTLVRQLPVKKTSTIAASCGSNQITLTATGNTRYETKKVKVDGLVEDGFNIYPGIPKVIQAKQIEVDGKKLCQV